MMEKLFEKKAKIEANIAGYNDLIAQEKAKLEKVELCIKLVADLDADAPSVATVASAPVQETPVVETPVVETAKEEEPVIIRYGIGSQK